ncbi:P-loop containing nucleoside triphosphate hydrolase protein [Ephemerocybe angulata]|uniref:P-loop containing nucleoside triphosphate hydrolase protein n=1 Tax=Ephemerocybe angulata TaxID=980116 RepID=A0A8H6HH76_9AGAR|nr:P-loop containing nucleoside triphosphate hydrolase protein [Tulosesus angulatus]
MRINPSAPLIRIPRSSSIYALGAANKRSKPLFETRDVEWTVNPEDSWALVGKGKGDIFQTLLGHTRVSPPPPEGLYPWFKQMDVDPFSRLKFVSFRHSIRGGSSGEFYDYTARYGAMRDGDDKTLGNSFLDILREESKTTETEYHALMMSLGLTEHLDVPLVALSNGQMRRARIARAILRRPDILLLDEPLTGLDTISRERLTHLLESFRSTPSAPTVLSSFRLQEVVDHGLKDVAPPFISHVVYLENERFWAGSRAEFFEDFAGRYLHKANGGYSGRPEVTTKLVTAETPLVVDMQGINVVYQGKRKVLDDVSWQIRQGERWHLQGSNGSGKTTLLSLLTGDHPQSYTQKHLLLPSSTAHRQHELKLRKRIPTAILQSSIGLVSPELFDAFPRKQPGMTVWDAVQTGFTGVFMPAGKGVGNVEHDDDDVKRMRVKRIWEVLEAIGPNSWADNASRDMTREFAARRFTDLTLGEQRVVLLMRALVGRPPLVILDEVWSGMEEGMVRAVKRYLTDDSNGAFGKEQAVVVVTHWEEEVPWRMEEGLKRFTLEGGQGHKSS